MRNIFWVLLCLVLFFSCKSIKETTAIKEIKPIKNSVLSSAQKRKFDYFFYEGERFKMQGNIDKAKMYFIECLKVDSLSSTCFYELSNIEIGYKNYKGAQDLLKQAVRLNPQNKWYKMLLGDLYQQNKDLPNAIVIYESLVQNYPLNDEYIYVLSQLYSQNKQFNKAIETYNLLEDNIGINEVISLEKEKIYLHIGKQSLAYKEIYALIKDNPYEPRYYGFLGDIYFYNKELDKAEESYKKILEIDNDNGLGCFSLANVSLTRNDTSNFFSYFEKGLSDENLNIEVKIQRMLPFVMGKDFSSYEDTARIFNLFDKLVTTHNSDARSYIYYANFLQNNHQKSSALKYYKKGINIDSSTPAVWQDMLLLEINMGKFDMLLIDSQKALLFFPDESIFNLFNGIAYMQAGDNKSAETPLLHGINFVKENKNLKGQFYSYLGDIQYDLGKSEEAFKNYEEALLINEHNVAVLNNFSYYLSLENKDLAKAEQMIAKCIELEPGNATYLDTYAWVLFKRGRYFEAKYIIERAVDNSKEISTEIIEHYGDILFKNGDKQGALDQWNKSRDQGNSNQILLKKIELKNYVED